jgi:hypothetical protein
MLFSRSKYSKVCNWLRSGHLMSFERLLSGPFFDWLRDRLSLVFRPTLVVKIKKMQESTPRFLKRITEDKENIILPFFTTGRFGPLTSM